MILKLWELSLMFRKMLLICLEFQHKKQKDHLLTEWCLISWLNNIKRSWITGRSQEHGELLASWKKFSVFTKINFVSQHLSISKCIRGMDLSTLSRIFSKPTILTILSWLLLTMFKVWEESFSKFWEKKQKTCLCTC